MRNSIRLGILLVVSLLVASSTKASELRIPWKGDYPHNSSKQWSRDNPFDSGFSKNFNNGTPEEYGQVKKDGELKAEILLPKGTTGPIPFMIVLHGCDGMSTAEKEWTNSVAGAMNAEGIGALIIDSYTTRYVDKSCGMPDLHWGRRRADDAYSGLDYLIEHNLAKPSEVYVMGYSNGGAASLIAMTERENDHKHRFAAGFPIAPNCMSVTVKYGDYYNPMIIFTGEKDDANIPEPCRELMKKKRHTPIQLIEYQGANHGFLMKKPDRVVKGWTDSHGKDHIWHLSYNAVADKDMMQTILIAVKTKKFVSGVIVRPTGPKAAQN
jgi:dienelactone hydrolase